MENKISYICKCACAQLIGKCQIRMADLLFLATRLNWIVGLVNILLHLKWQHESDSDNMSMIFLLPFVHYVAKTIWKPPRRAILLKW